VENSSIYALVAPNKTIQPQNNNEQINNEEQINNDEQINSEVETNNENLPQPSVNENVDAQPSEPEIQTCEDHYHRNGSTCTKDTYTITWKNEDGSVRDTTEVEYGEIPTHADANQSSDEQYTYEFKGWIPDFVQATSDAEYIASYKYTLNNYTVTWEDEDGTVLKTDTAVPYGTMPSYNTNPTKE